MNGASKRYILVYLYVQLEDWQEAFTPIPAKNTRARVAVVRFSHSRATSSPLRSRTAPAKEHFAIMLLYNKRCVFCYKYVDMNSRAARSWRANMTSYLSWYLCIQVGINIRSNTYLVIL